VGSPCDSTPVRICRELLELDDVAGALIGRCSLQTVQEHFADALGLAFAMTDIDPLSLAAGLLELVKYSRALKAILELFGVGRSTGGSTRDCALSAALGGRRWLSAGVVNDGDVLGKAVCDDTCG
jgi:hypothetical protein